MNQVSAKAGTSNSRCDLILKIKNVLKFSLEPVGPQTDTHRSINKLRQNAHTVSRLANASIKHIADTKFPADLLHINSPPLVGET